MSHFKGTEHLAMSEIIFSEYGYYYGGDKLGNDAAFPLDPASFGNNDQTFSPGEMGTFFGVYTVNYVGQTGDGGAVFFDGNGYYVFSNNPLPNTMPSYTAQDFVPCFCPGTLISTPRGAVAVEDLRIGDEILTIEGKAVAVKWVGKRRVHSLFARQCDALPIQISAGALGDGLPQRDLFVSPDHAMYVEGCLVQAAALVNGSTIRRVAHWTGDVQYLHIETENHDLICAEGAATETFVNTDTRKRFDNHAEYEALYPNEPGSSEPMDLPRVCFRRQLPSRIAQRLQAIASVQNAA